MSVAEYYTYEDYFQWEGNWELIKGLPLEIFSHTIIHQSLMGNILFELNNSIEKNNEFLVVAGVDWKISNNTVLRPDIVIAYNKTNEAYITKAPEIIVEVISKSTAKRDEVHKFKIYEEEKVKYYVIVYPNDLKAKVYRLEGNNYTKEGDFSLETYDFEETTCKASVNFANVFERFRK